MFGFLKPPKNNKSAAVARDRLQILLAHERSSASTLDVLPALQRDIFLVIQKHLKIAKDDVEVEIVQHEGVSALEINIEIPDKAGAEA